MGVVVYATKLWSVLYLSLALPVKGGARSVKPARHLTVAGKTLKLKRPRRVVVCAPRALKGALGESRTEGVTCVCELTSQHSTLHESRSSRI